MYVIVRFCVTLGETKLSVKVINDVINEYYETLIAVNYRSASFYHFLTGRSCVGTSNIQVHVIHVMLRGQIYTAM